MERFFVCCFWGCRASFPCNCSVAIYSFIRISFIVHPDGWFRVLYGKMSMARSLFGDLYALTGYVCIGPDSRLSLSLSLSLSVSCTVPRFNEKQKQNVLHLFSTVVGLGMALHRQHFALLVGHNHNFNSITQRLVHYFAGENTTSDIKKKQLKTLWYEKKSL